MSIAPRAAARKPGHKIVRKRLSSLRPSPENEAIYSAIDWNIQDNLKFVESIQQEGLHEPLIVTLDGYIASGHRRYGALKRIGQVWAPCRVLPFRRSEMSRSEYTLLLRDHNRQRNKSAAEALREELVDIDPDQAYQALLDHRDKSIYAHEYNSVPTLHIEGRSRRSAISGQKADHVKYIKQVVFHDRKDYWPLSVRGIHYPLLNYKFFRNIPKKIRYLNNSQSYSSTSDLLTRLRLNGEIPWEALDDPTRPLKVFQPFRDVRQFAQLDIDRLLTGYWRDLLQTQPNYVHVLCEKNTVYHMVLRVTDRYQIPTSSGRGFSSIDPWHDLYERYIDSGKERLIVIVLSDYDPEGELIPIVGGRTLRDDFGVQKLNIVKAGVTRQQIDEHNLPKQNFAKEESNNLKWFVDRNDGDNSVYELEALDPGVMLADLENVIQNVIDVDLYNAEVEQEREEATTLEAFRKAAAELLKGLVA